MSYILDALTKAAKQRERQIPVVQRLLSPAPSARPSRTRVLRGRAAALVLGAGVLGALLVWWLRPVSIEGPGDPLPVVSTPMPRAPVAVEPSRAITVERLPRADAPVETPTPVESKPAPAPPVATAAPKPTPPAARPTPAPQRPPTAASARQPVPAAAPPVASAPAASPSERSGLKLEALIYSDVPTQRMVFINGRRHVEGDVIDGRLRVEEIHEDGVELSDQGRRFTLRVAR